MSKDPDRHDSIDVVPYDTRWPAMAQAEITRIEQAITDDNLLEIQHVGSTSVPGAWAKPVVDIVQMFPLMVQILFEVHF